MKNDILSRFADYFDKNNISYAKNEEKNALMLCIDLQNELGIITEHIFQFANTYTVVAFCEQCADASNRSKVANYLLQANNGSILANFQLNFDTGTISAKAVQILGDTMPNDDEINLCIKAPLRLFELYGDGLAKVLAGAATPDEAIETSKSAQNSAQNAEKGESAVDS